MRRQCLLLSCIKGYDYNYTANETVLQNEKIKNTVPVARATVLLFFFFFFFFNSDV